MKLCIKDFIFVKKKPVIWKEYFIYLIYFLKYNCFFSKKSIFIIKKYISSIYIQGVILSHSLNYN